jgi:16S rRNA (guanine966-N2)-methyltransferase
MRIIAGSAGGIPIKVPQGDTRPTTDRVREALFSMLGDTIANARILDLFAGSGALGLEALSRGAASVLFVEQNRNAAEIIRLNLQKARLANATVRQADVFRTLADLAKTGQIFDLIFADPPYAHHKDDPDLSTLVATSPLLPQLLPSGGHLILESLASRTQLTTGPSWQLERQRDYGTTRITWLRLPPNLPSPRTPP